MTKRKLHETRPRPIVIPPQDEVYRGVQILWDGYVYWITKPSGRIEASRDIALIRAAIDLIHMLMCNPAELEIDMAAVTEMTEETP